MFKLHSTLSLAPICFILQRKTSLQNREQNVSLEARSLSLPSHHINDQPRLLIMWKKIETICFPLSPDNICTGLARMAAHLTDRPQLVKRKRLQVFNWRDPDLGRRMLPESGVMVVLVLIPYLNLNTTCSILCLNNKM